MGVCAVSPSLFADAGFCAAWVGFFLDGCAGAAGTVSAASCDSASEMIGHGKRSLSHACALLTGITASAAAATIAKLRGVSILLSPKRGYLIVMPEMASR